MLHISENRPLIPVLYALNLSPLELKNTILTPYFPAFSLFFRKIVYICSMKTERTIFAYKTYFRDFIKSISDRKPERCSTLSIC